ncbi:MAG: translational GTPase TypA [Myxococcota bacterium]|jgi:GTP-binding protein|nr:translational GTPase TypA [Myxococcota bacterium]
MSTDPLIRNIAIIAHVDHGKTTLVDHMLRQGGTFKAHEELADRVMDSGDLERERGITILSKPTGIRWGDHKINIVDTPGHADFGAEVERVLRMVDGVLLLVDAAEGPLPQTRFVLSKALGAGLEVMVCINKIDRPDARAEEVLDQIYDLFIELDAEEEQLEFPVFYACAKEGYAHTENKQEPGNLHCIFEAIVDHIPAPTGDPEGVPQVLITQLGHDPYLGRLAIGRVMNGQIQRNREYALAQEEKTSKIKVVQLSTFEGLNRTQTEHASVGEIIAIAGIAQLEIGDTVTSLENPQPLPRPSVDEPTLGITFWANSGPFSALDGKKVTAREIRERLEHEAQHNVALRLEDGGSPDAIRVLGRGELQMAILIEQMRREGYELCVSKPEVRILEEDGRKTEPYELAMLDFPETAMGAISEKMNQRKGRMISMRQGGSGRTVVEFRIPTRGLIGFRGEYLTETRGEGILNTIFDGFDDYAGHIEYRKRGSLVADRKGVTTAYALFTLQQRGQMFVGIQVNVYEGMIVGASLRENDMNVNPCKPKQLNNIRSAGADEKLILAPPVQMTLEKALEYISDDELVEITPNHIRLRKKVLAGNMRSVVRGEKKKEKQPRG